LGVFNSGETNRVDRVLIPALYEIFFEAEFADGCIYTGFHAGVAHGEDAGLHSHFGCDFSGDFRQRLALLEQFRAQQMDGKIAVAGVKPDGLSQVAHGLQTKKCVALDAPAPFLAEQPGHEQP
jgi:hypothetical protein